MKNFREIVIRNRLFFILWLLFLAVGLFFLVAVGKAAAFVDLNPYHRSTLDTVFQWITFLGDGFFTLIVFVIFLIRRWWSWATQIIAAFVISGLLAQIIKRIFAEARPRTFFHPGAYPYFIDKVTRIGFASFPSGHTTTIFALATLLAIFSTNWRARLACLLGAVAVGYSRIYLGQHFLGDVIMGSIVGTATAVLIHWLFAEKLDSLPLFRGPDARGPEANPNRTQ